MTALRPIAPSAAQWAGRCQADRVGQFRNAQFRANVARRSVVGSRNILKVALMLRRRILKYPQSGPTLRRRILKYPSPACSIYPSHTAELRPPTRLPSVRHASGWKASR